MKTSLPVGAITAGTEADGSRLYSIRAKVSGAEAIGQYNDARKEAKVTAFDVPTYDLATRTAD